MTSWFELDVTSEKNNILVRLLHVLAVVMSLLNASFVLFLALSGRVQNWIQSRGEVVGDRYHNLNQLT